MVHKLRGAWTKRPLELLNSKQREGSPVERTNPQHWFAAICLSAFFLCGSSLVLAQTAGSRRTVDGRFGTQCSKLPGGDPTPVCTISFYRLIALPERYDGKRIQITGFLVAGFDGIFLYPNKPSYDADVEGESVKFCSSFELPKDISDRLDVGVFPVSVIGTFDAHYGGDASTNPRLGCLREIFRAAYLPRISN